MASTGKQRAKGGKRGATRTALLVVDMQNDFVERDGSLSVGGGEEVLAGVNRLVQLFHDAGAPVVYTQDWHPEDHVSFARNHEGRAPFEQVRLPCGTDQVLWPAHCVQGSRGAEFHAKLRVLPAAAPLVVRKGTERGADSYSGFRDNNREERTELAGLLRRLGVDRVVCVGLAFDYCVGFTALDAAEERFPHVVVVEDLTRPVAADSAAAMRKRLRDAGVQLVAEKDVPAGWARAV